MRVTQWSVLTKTSSSAVGVCLGLGVERTLLGGVVVPFVYEKYNHYKHRELVKSPKPEVKNKMAKTRS